MKINHSFQINSLLKMILIVFNVYLRKIVLQEVGESFLRENWFEMSGLFSSLLIFTISKTILTEVYGA